MFCLAAKLKLLNLSGISEEEDKQRIYSMGWANEKKVLTVATPLHDFPVLIQFVFQDLEASPWERMPPKAKFVGSRSWYCWLHYGSYGLGPLYCFPCSTLSDRSY